MSKSEVNDLREGLDIAIIGMAGRFPGARDIEAFWRNLRDGVESISIFTEEQMRSFGVNSSALRDPSFVKAGAMLNEIDMFDAAFFAYSPREAEVIDPQSRLFLECAWESLENAGYDAERFVGMIGVYAGTSMSTYLLYNLLSKYIDSPNTFEAMIGNDKDFLTTRVSYEMNLRGPSVCIQSACSSSLVATHLACQALLSYQCDIALVGGVSVQVPQRTGHYYREGDIMSPDGHCRAFDAKAEGTTFGSGVGVVALKRLSEAMQDGDSIHAVIKGSAVNNDGSAKIGYTAPAINGQAQVISLAQLVAGVDAETITYVEAHGTGTALGDPVEVAALTEAFRATTDKKGYCALGSVKSNIGHVDAAAGVAALIKTALALKHGMIPPSLHFEQPNPKIDFENSPFYVNCKLTEWKTEGHPRRAGVSSLGIGGTNAHVIVEEPPPVEESGSSRPWQMLPLSAKTGTALEMATANLVSYLKEHADANLADVAYTLQRGRKVFDCRRIAVCRDVEDACRALEQMDPHRVFTAQQEATARPVAFMFPGGGAQYVNMGRDLYDEEPIFRGQVDSCAELLRPLLGYDLRKWLYPSDSRVKEMAEQMKQTSVGLPALFTVEYALANLWMSWGVQPHAVIGHSLGEYTAACLAGVFSLPDALSLVVLRSKLFEKLPKGAMLSVPLPSQEVEAMMDGQLSFAAINGPSQCVVSGPVGAIERMARLFAENEIEYKKLQIDVAAHSPMVKAIMDEFIRGVEEFELHAPNIDYVSNVTGTWITSTEATDPHYWGRHLLQTVRFADGLGELLQDPNSILLEVGPGQTLSTLARLQSGNPSAQSIISSMRHPYESQPDMAVLTAALGKLWVAGADIQWLNFYQGQRRRRIPLPTYPFERKRYWIEPEQRQAQTGGKASARKADISEWFYIPGWKRTLLPKRETGAAGEGRIYVVMGGEEDIAGAILKELGGGGEDVVVVKAGDGYRKESDKEYRMNPRNRDEYDEVLEEVRRRGAREEVIVHLWSMGISKGETEREEEYFERVQEMGYYSLLYLAQALAGRDDTLPTEIWVVTDDLHEIESNDSLCPEKATLLGAMKVIPQEYEHIICKCIDVGRAGSGREEGLAGRIAAEVRAKSRDTVIAFRGSNRWAQRFEAVDIQADESLIPFQQNGVYLITGGLGSIGLHLAEYLAGVAQARLILIQRSTLPEKQGWQDWLDTHDEHDAIARKIRKVQTLEDLGAEVMVISADVAGESQMRLAVGKAVDRFGRINGVIHCAGMAGQHALKLICEADRSQAEAHFQAKVYGLYTLERVLREQPVDWCLLFSSNAAVLGGLGSIGYTAANLFMDSFVSRRGLACNTRWISCNWDGWLVDEASQLSPTFQTSLDQYAMQSGESLEAFRRVISSGVAGQVIISTGSLEQRFSIWISRLGSGGERGAGEGSLPGPLHERPDLSTLYVPPTDELEEKIVSIWQELLGIQQLGVHDNFFDLGGDSLISLKVTSRLKKELGVDISVVAIFEGPTVKALAKLIGQSQNQEPDHDESRARGERRKQRRRQKGGALPTL